jgi:two-component system response regulator WspF
LVIVGASTGGPVALVTVLAGLPPTFHAAIVVVQHVGEEFCGELAQWLAGQIRLPARVAMRGDRPHPGEVVLAGGRDDLVMTPGLDLAYRRPVRQSFYHPSVDVFFKSVAAYWPTHGLAVLLTGIGRDGAEGLLALRSAGWSTIAQDQASSVVYGMPKAAVDLGAAAEVLSLEQIGPAINRFDPIASTWAPSHE